jgi:hypothetical protein
MTGRHPTRGGGPDPVRYEIRITGALDGRWATWFDGMTLRADGDGATVIAGPVADQAALHGLLQRVRDLGIPLVSVTAIDPDSSPTAGPPDPAATHEQPTPG